MKYGARRVLEEAVDDRAAAQQRVFLLGLAIECDIGIGKVEKMLDVLARQACDSEEMTVRKGAYQRSFIHEPWTIGRGCGPGKHGRHYRPGAEETAEGEGRKAASAPPAGDGRTGISAARRPSTRVSTSASAERSAPLTPETGTVSTAARP